MEVCGEALVGFVCAHGDAFEFLELAEEVLDQVSPLMLPDVQQRVYTLLSRSCSNQQRSCPIVLLRPNPWSFRHKSVIDPKSEGAFFVLRFAG
jgi:hypothetical protein